MNLYEIHLHEQQKINGRKPSLSSQQTGVGHIWCDELDDDEDPEVSEQRKAQSNVVDLALRNIMKFEKNLGFFP